MGHFFFWSSDLSAVLSRVRVALFVDIRQFFVRIYREINIIYMLILMLIQSKPYIADTLYSDFFSQKWPSKTLDKRPNIVDFYHPTRVKAKTFSRFHSDFAFSMRYNSQQPQSVEFLKSKTLKLQELDYRCTR